MADPSIIAVHAKADRRRQKHLAQMQEHRNTMAAYNILAPANTLAHGARMNEIRGTTPFVAANAARGLGTAVLLLPGALPTVYTPARPAGAGRKRRRRR